MSARTAPPTRTPATPATPAPAAGAPLSYTSLYYIALGLGHAIGRETQGMDENMAGGPARWDRLRTLAQGLYAVADHVCNDHVCNDHRYEEWEMQSDRLAAEHTAPSADIGLQIDLGG